MSFSGGFRDLKVYQLSFNLAMEIFYESRKFPPEEKYSLTDQIRRASRSVPGNIGEGYRKKRYPKMFVSKMADADGEATETQVWLDFANECGYLSQQRQLELRKGYEEVGRMLGGMIAHPERFSNSGSPQGTPADCSCRLLLFTDQVRSSILSRLDLQPSPPRCRCERR